MVSKESRAEIREEKHRRIRNRISGTASRPRLAVYRSNKNMYAQIIDDETGATLVTVRATSIMARSRHLLMQQEKLGWISKEEEKTQ